MIYRTLLISLTIFTLTTCKNQTALTTEKTKAVESTKVITNSEVTETHPSIPKTSNHLPVNTKDVKISDQETEKPKLSDSKGIIYLKEGENKFLKEYEMNVTFKRMVEDSRCPKDVQCVWAGNAIAEVEFMGIYTRPVTVQLSTINDTKKGHSTTRKFNGYSIALIEVTPQSTSAKGFKSLQGSYQITLQFTKDSGPDSPTERGGITTK